MSVLNGRHFSGRLDSPQSEFACVSIMRRRRPLTNKPHEQTTPTRQCGPGQPPEPHCTWISRLCFSTADAVGRRSRSDSAPRKEYHFYRSWNAEHDFHHRSHPSAVASGPILLKEQDEEEAAMPGQPAHVRTHSGMSPAIHPRELPACHWLCRNHQQAQQALTFSLPILCGRPGLSATGNPRLLVQKL